MGQQYKARIVTHVSIFIPLLLCAKTNAVAVIETRVHEESEKKFPDMREKEFSLISACKREARELCPDQEQAPLKCLLCHFASGCAGEPKESSTTGQQPRRGLPAFSKECSGWLQAREECVSFARSAGHCHDGETARECLRRIPKHLLSAGCRDSAYYRSVLLYGKMKQKQEDTPRGESA
uniref:Uncharacterized protein n=1 Tax=Trypanosoma congolense (strain IL3000) TaxID=1068625 RepID=G0UW97_TRYCI|nr:conserved hypothetical protein [Trypanosoma congolense IL3000]